MLKEKGTLFIVATPIGNLEDITLRAIRILGEVDYVLCEDTRTTQKLLQKYEIKTKTISYNSHTTENKNQKILNDLLDGKNIALVSDAGTPGISDPGSYLINYIKEKTDKVIFSPIPGPSALTAIWSVSGLPGNEFYFAGFIPQKKGRETFLKKSTQQEIPIVFYESGHRIIKLFEWFLENSPNTEFIIGRELTKTFETIVHGEPAQIIEYLKDSPSHVKGEFVIILKNKNKVK